MTTEKELRLQHAEVERISALHEKALDDLNKAEKSVWKLAEMREQALEKLLEMTRSAREVV